MVFYLNIIMQYTIILLFRKIASKNFLKVNVNASIFSRIPSFDADSWTEGYVIAKKKILFLQSGFFSKLKN